MSVDLFAALTREFCTVIMSARDMALEDRVVQIHASLSGVMAAGCALPVVPGTVAKVQGGVLEEVEWPGLASFEPYWSVGLLERPDVPVPRTATASLGVIFAQLFSGLELWDGGDAEAAAGRWGMGFESGWGVVAAELLFALHPVVVAYRADLRGNDRRGRGAVPSDLVTLAGEGEPRPTAGRAMLGVRFGGVTGTEVLAVHPASPAFGLLEVGDLILEVDGLALNELDGATVSASLVGAVGQPVQYGVFRRDGGTDTVVIAAVDSGEFG